VRISLAGVVKAFGAQTVLDHVDLALGPRSRLGLVGRNGVGKSTLLRLLAGLEQPDEGRVERSPPSLTVGYLPQEHDRRTGETLLAYLGRRTGVAEAERELERHSSEWDADAYAAALERFTALGGGDLEARARTLCADLGLSVPLEQTTATLSGGEAARAGLAAILLSRFDVLLLDEPTNDLDFDGLDRLERFLDGYEGGLAVVSHDRAFLDRTVTRIAEIDPWTAKVTEFAGGWNEYAAQRDEARRAAWAEFEQAQARRRELTALLNRRKNEARTLGAGLGDKTGGQDRRATHALSTKVRQAEKLLSRNELPAKPFQPWELNLSLTAGTRLGDLVLRLDGAVAERGDFRLGPLDLDLLPGERLAVTGRNGSGKSTLLAVLLGELPLTAGTRALGRTTVLGSLEQTRAAADEPLLEAMVAATGLTVVDARTLLAKFGLGATHVLRPTRSLSPGERTRARLAELQARGVNCLVLDEPTNHLDLEAVEELEEALAAYDGTAVVVSHDRRFLERFAPTRELAL
jgi:ATPase subunit of ABC transporter with duplicated ATPase domains